MNTCSTCKHWSRESSCKKITDEPEDEDSGAWIYQHHNLEVELMTSPNFGCVLHKPKDTP
jgi:hypothetical protein